MRLSRTLRQSKTSTDPEPDPEAVPEAVPIRRALLWLAFGAVLVLGLALYFKYERLVVPLLT